MGFVTVKCPDCGATVNIDGSREYGFCNYCGAKVMQDKVVVEHRGSVSINNSPKVEQWLKSARTSLSTGFYEQAVKYYDLVLTESPEHWEAVFYSKYCRAMSCKIFEVQSVAVSLMETAMLSIELAASLPRDSFRNAVRQISNSFISFCESANSSCMKGYSDAWPNTTTSYNYDHNMRIGALIIAAITVGKHIDGKEAIADLADPLLEEGIALRVNFSNWLVDRGVKSGFPESICPEAEAILKKHNPNYVPPKVKQASGSSGGCYVATCVYGSYDCPQVWTLRRYRDNTLASTWYGRAFVKIYYAASPTLVAWFGHTEWFKNLWRNKLDRMVASLQKDGVENTPYQDKDW